MSDPYPIYADGDSYAIDGIDEVAEYSYWISIRLSDVTRYPEITPKNDLLTDISHELLPGETNYNHAYNIHLYGDVLLCLRQNLRWLLCNDGIPVTVSNETIRLIYEVYESEHIEADVRIETHYNLEDPEFEHIEAELSYELRSTPASREAVDALEKVTIAVSAEIEAKSCMVCLEELVVGSEGTMMPCSHVYHGECIVKWLENRFMCPVCRFELPHDEE